MKLDTQEIGIRNLRLLLPFPVLVVVHPGVVIPFAGAGLEIEEGV